MNSTPSQILRNILIAAAVSVYACSSLTAQVTAEIDVTRTSGVAPLAVYFDASATTASGVSYPMHELYFEWDFGDPDAGNWAISGLSKNVATSPAAAHVFETPGTYDVTLYVRDANGNSGVELVTITVTDPDTVYAGTNTVCFSTDGDFSGAPAGAQQVTTNSFTTVLSHQGTNKRLLLRRGQTFNTSGSQNLTATGPCMLGAFGSGSELPRIATSGSGNNHIIIYRGPDWRVVDIEFQGGGLSGSGLASARETTDILLFRTRMVPGTFHAGFNIAGNNLDLNGEDIPQGVFIVDNDWRDIGFGAGGNFMFLAVGRFAIMGNHLEDSTGGEHIIRLQHGEKGVFSHNYFGEQNGGKHLLTLRNRNQGGNCSAGCGEDTREIFVSDNIFVNHSDWAVQLVANNSTGDTAYGRDFIFERNFFKGGAANEGQRAWELRTSENITLRNNVILMNEWRTYRAVAVPGDMNNVWVYNNSAYTVDSPSGQVRLIDMGSGSGINRVAKNNLLYAPNANSPLVVTGSGTDMSHNLVAASNPFIASVIDGPEDFELHASSVAIDAGTAVNDYVDFILNPRPAETTWDVGAYEFGIATVVLVTGVSVSPETLTLEALESHQLTATVSPSKATNKSVSWASDDTDVATVDSSGNVVAIAEGTATITVRTEDGDFEDSVIVTVTVTVPEAKDFAGILGGVETVVENQYESDWFGVFVTGEDYGNWIWHEGLGWLYAGLVEDADELWLWSPDMSGWIYTEATIFPFIHIVSEESWSWYALLDGVGHRYDYTQSQWVPIQP